MRQSQTHSLRHSDPTFHRSPAAEPGDGRQAMNGFVRPWTEDSPETLPPDVLCLFKQSNASILDVCGEPEMPQRFMATQSLKFGILVTRKRRHNLMCVGVSPHDSQAAVFKNRLSEC